MKKMIFAALLAFAILAMGCTQPAAPTGGQQNQAAVPNNTVAPTASVMITSFSFQPETVTVAKGATVTWTNQDPMAHTVTGTDFDSGSVGSGQTYSHVFDKAGTYEYHCTIHPSMKGTIIVQ